MFKIGEFSKLTLTSIRMLRHYDEIGLLKPNHIDTVTGYRYYSVNQLSDMSRIQYLKNMGLPLARICTMLKCSDKEVLRQVLADCLEARKEEYGNIVRQITAIEKELNRLEKGCVFMSYTVLQKTMPERMVFSLRKTIGHYSREGELWAQLNREIAPQKPVFTNPPINTALYHDLEYKEEGPDVEIQTAVLGSYKDTENVIFKKIPEMLVASITFKGSYEQMGEINREAMEWMVQNGFLPDGAMFSIYHVSPGMDQNPDNWLTEACYPMRRK